NGLKDFGIPLIKSVHRSNSLLRNLGLLKPLINGHAHNDYECEKPLLKALSSEFTLLVEIVIAYFTFNEQCSKSR
ncbi:MAG: hypothetical protein AAFX57_15720, partial [Bacteroidota bacterium]